MDVKWEVMKLWEKLGQNLKARDGFEIWNRVVINQKFRGWDYHRQNDIDKFEIWFSKFKGKNKGG